MIRNNTLTFLLPFLSNKRYNKEFFLNKYFIGSFIEDVDRYSYEYEILLVYRRKPTFEYHEFEFDLIFHPYFSKISYDYSDKSTVIFVFKIPVSLEEDYDFITNGNHTKISPSMKLKIVKFWNVEFIKKGKINSYLFNPKNLENSKWIIPDYEDEIFDINKVK